MKSIISFLAVLIIALTVTCSGQTTKDYWIKWSPNPAADSISFYEVYWQTQQNNSGWGIVDGAEWTSGLQTYFKATVPHVKGQLTDYSYKITVPLAGGWQIAGIIANNGIRSVVGASTAVKVDKKPGKPTNVRIEQNP